MDGAVLGDRRLRFLKRLAGADLVRKIASAGLLGLDAERVMREDDPEQRAIDDAVLERAEELREEEIQDTAILINNAIVKAFSAKG